MAFPKLVRNARTPVRVVIVQEEANEFGERPVILDNSFKCNYQDSGMLKYTAEKQRAEVTGAIYIDGDILESLGIAASNFSVTPDGILTLIGCKVDEDGVCSYDDPGEMASDLAVFGHVIIFGRKRQIVRGTKARNLDGTVNYTRLDVK